MSDPTHIDVEDLPGLGWLRFCWQGEENTYFTTETGRVVFVKLATA